MHIVKLLKSRIEKRVDEDTILTVSELTATIKEILESNNKLRNIKIRGEVSNVTSSVG